jgi:transposase
VLGVDSGGMDVIQAPKLDLRTMRYELTDCEYDIFWVMRSGVPWRDLPESYRPHTTCYNRFVRWRQAGVWDNIMSALAAAIVVDVTRSAYTDPDIPYHSRWRHFAAGGHDRWAMLRRAFGDLSRRDFGRVAADLAIVNVLLDAGAGDAWDYRDSETGQTLSRSEGLSTQDLARHAHGTLGNDSDCRR